MISQGLLARLHRLWTDQVDDAEAVLAECLVAGRAALGMSTAYLAELVDDEVCIRIAHTDDVLIVAGECLPVAEALCAETCRTGVSVVLDSSMSVPIHVAGRMYGCLVFSDPEAGAPPVSEDGLAFVELLACRAGSALEAEWLSDAALHDHLTGLPNRRLLLDRLRQALARRGRQSGVLAVLFVDLDEFKRVNDTWRHEGGDIVLCEMAQRICRAVRPGDTVARPHGDEFVVVCEDIPDAARAEALARRIVDGVAAPVRIGTDQVTVTCSVGIALIGADPDHGRDRARRC